MAKFKVGDRVRSRQPSETYEGTLISIDSEMAVVDRDGYGKWGCKIVGEKIATAYGVWDKKSFLELISSPKSNMSNIKEKFILALTKEPNKSFRKAGITNGDDLLTDEGTTIFLTWLLNTKHADEFKKDVVDGLLAEEKE